MANVPSQVAQHFELEAIARMEVFELDGTNCVYDQDEWLGLHVWDLFIKAKFIESNPKAGLSPRAAELSRIVSKRFNFSEAVKHIVEDKPNLKMAFHQGGKVTLLRALGLAARSMSLSPEQIIASLSQFYQHKPATSSQETANSSQETANPSQETANPSQETANPSQETANPSQETANPSQETANPSQETANPSQETANPSQETANPSQETANPSQETNTATTEPDISPQSDSSYGEDPQLRESRTNTEQTYEDYMYTSALKEMGDIEGSSPTYTFNRLSLEPSKWGATVQYKQSTSFSEGISKKAAKHSASKALWLKLGKGAIL